MGNNVLDFQILTADGETDDAARISTFSFNGP